MSPQNPHHLYAVEPNGVRFIRWVRETSAVAIRLYWYIFVGIPATLITLLAALAGTVAGTVDLVRRPAQFQTDLPLIGICVAFLVFQRVRAFFWALLGCFAVWVLLLAVVLRPILGKDYAVGTTGAKILLGVADFLPPIIAALYIDNARRQKAPLHRGEKLNRIVRRRA